MLFLFGGGDCSDGDGKGDFDENCQPGADVVGVSGVEDLGGRGRSGG